MEIQVGARAYVTRSSKGKSRLCCTNASSKSSDAPGPPRWVFQHNGLSFTASWKTFHHQLKRRIPAAPPRAVPAAAPWSAAARPAVHATNSGHAARRASAESVGHLEQLLRWGHFSRQLNSCDRGPGRIRHIRRVLLANPHQGMPACRQPITHACRQKSASARCS